jgi:hypothetical protein
MTAGVGLAATAWMIWERSEVREKRRAEPVGEDDRGAAALSVRLALAAT